MIAWAYPSMLDGALEESSVYGFATRFAILVRNDKHYPSFCLIWNPLIVVKHCSILLSAQVSSVWCYTTTITSPESSNCLLQLYKINHLYFLR